MRSRSLVGRLIMSSGIVLVGMIVLAGVSAQATGGKQATELKIYQQTVSVRSAVQCRKYEGKTLYCTASPQSALQDLLHTKLILGYSGVTIKGATYEVEPGSSNILKLNLRGKDRQMDYSGMQELDIEVIYIK